MKQTLLTALIVSLVWALIFTRAQADADKAILILEGRVEQMQQTLDFMSLVPRQGPGLGPVQAPPAQAKPKRNPLVV
jgi:hypothetical protein